MEDRLITDGGKCKILGITLKNSLTWDSHLNEKGALLPRVRSLIGRLFLVGQNMTKTSRLKLVNSLVLSKMSYGLCLWGNTSNNHRDKAQIVMNSAARLVTRRERHTRQTDLLRECGWLDVENWTIHSSLIQLWKAYRWNTPDYLGRLLIGMEEEKLITTPPRLLLTAQSFRNKTVENWNRLPANIRAETSLAMFKKQTKTWLRDRD